jgi:hypothetical protein
MNLDHDVRWIEPRFRSPTSIIDPAASHLPCAESWPHPNEALVEVTQRALVAP